MTITNNAGLDQAMRALGMALYQHRAETGVAFDPAVFELRVSEETWHSWQAQASDIHPVLADAIFNRHEFMGLKIVRDNETELGRLVLRCTWEMAIL